MMKKLLSFMLMASMVLSFNACGKDDDEETADEQQSETKSGDKRLTCAVCYGSGECIFCDSEGNCNYCDGTGYDSSAATKQCSFCWPAGSGNCGKCGGYNKCQYCNGTGYQN